MFTDPLKNIRVAAPCPADWNEMYGDERKRFCSECKLNVYNLSGMTRREAERLIVNAEGRLCVRFFRRADGTVLTKNCPVGWARHQAPRLSHRHRRDRAYLWVRRQRARSANSRILRFRASHGQRPRPRRLRGARGSSPGWCSRPRRRRGSCPRANSPADRSHNERPTFASPSTELSCVAAAY